MTEWKQIIGHGQGKSRIATPKLIRSLVKNNIQTQLIAAGQHHSILVSNFGQIRVFGWNEFYQCGTGDDINVYLPKLNPVLVDKQIKDVKCGFNHNVAITKTDEYYLWGHNRYRQCMVYDEKQKCVKYPTKWNFINDIGPYRKILDIYPGWNETRVVTNF